MRYDQHRYEEADQLYNQALDISRNEFGQEYVTAVSALSNIGALLSDQRKFDQAESFLLQGYKAILTHLGPNHAAVIESTQRLIQNYEQTNQPKKAASYRTAPTDPQ